MSVRIGFIGSGGIASHHMGQLAGQPNAEMVAFCDAVEERARSRAEQYGGRAYTDFRQMLDREDLDAVFICTPPHVHGEIEFACIDRGLPMFIEKPVSNDLALAEAIRDRIEAEGIITCVGYHWRHLEATRAAVEALAGKTVCMALGFWCGGFPMVPWWRKRAQGGGQNVEQTTHIFDLLRYLCGEVAEVQAMYAQRVMHEVVEGSDVDDVGCVNLRFESGAVASVTNCCCVRNWGLVGVKVLAHDVVCEIGGDGSGVVVPASGPAQSVQPTAEQPQRVTAAFLRAVEARDQAAVPSPYADAVRTLAVTAAAEEAARTGGTVSLGRG